MTKRPTPTAPTAPAVTEDKATAPAVTDTLAAILAATDESARHAIVRPISTKDRKSLVAAANTAMIAASDPAVILSLVESLKAITTAPSGSDPALSVVAMVERETARFAAILVAASDYFGTDTATIRDNVLTGAFDAVTDDHKAQGARLIERAAAGAGSGTRETRDRTADMVTLKGQALTHALKDGKTVKATVSADGTSVTAGGKKFASLSAAAGAMGAQAGRVDGWSWWRTADGATCDAYVREHGAK